MAERLIVWAGTLITPRSRFEQVTVVVERGLIHDILPGTYLDPEPGDRLLDARSQAVGPGFVDLHVHGGGGYDTMDGTVEAIEGLAAFHAQHGTTALLPSTVAAPPEACHCVLEAVGAAIGTPSAGARVLGAHVEGPFLSQRKRGAHAAAQVRAFERERDPWLFTHLAAIRRVTLAPELPGALALISELRRSGVLVALGHSEAGEELVGQAVLAGATHVTHLYNAMSAMEKVGAIRRAGLAEAALLRDDLSVEVIADGFHVPVPVLQMVVRLKGPACVALVTDANRAAGLPEGRYQVGMEEVACATVRDGMAVTDEGGLAGSVATMDQLVRNMVERAGLPLPQAWQMASLTPARILGAHKLGQVAVGNEGDLVVLDADLRVAATVVAGRVAYES